VGPLPGIGLRLSAKGMEVHLVAHHVDRDMQQILEVLLDRHHVQERATLSQIHQDVEIAPGTIGGG